MGTLSGTILKTKVKYFPKILEFDNFHFSFFAYLRSKYTDTIFLNKFNFITFLGSWNFKIVKIGEISRGRVEVRDFLLPILVINRVTSR